MPNPNTAYVNVGGHRYLNTVFDQLSLLEGLNRNKIQFAHENEVKVAIHNIFRNPEKQRDYADFRRFGEAVQQELKNVLYNKYINNTNLSNLDEFAYFDISSYLKKNEKNYTGRTLGDNLKKHISFSWQSMKQDL